MQDARVRYALLFLCLVCLFGSGYVLLSGRRMPTEAAYKPVVITPPPSAVAASIPARAALLGAAAKLPTRLYVDVSGAVRRPSLYLLPAESRVMQAIQAAGGPTAEADLGGVNLAQKVADGDKIVVPKRSASLSPSAAAPLSPEAALRPNGGKSAASRSAKISAGASEQIGLNTATAAQFQRLPGVGPALAARILAYRQSAGSFSKIEDLTQVTGIGPKKFARIAPFVKLD